MSHPLNKAGQSIQMARKMLDDGSLPERFKNLPPKGKDLMASLMFGMFLFHQLAGAELAAAFLESMRKTTVSFGQKSIDKVLEGL